jgi:hypothetical protein
MSELGFCSLLALYCLLCGGGGGGGVLGGSTEDMIEQYLLFFGAFMVSIIGGVERFVPVVIVIERGDATGA